MHVLIATHGRPALLERCLASLSACERADDYAGTWVVENGSRMCEAIVRSHGARYLHVAEPGKCRALNRGLAAIGGGLVLFSDDDTEVDPGWLLAYADARRRYPRSAFFGGPVEALYERPPPGWMQSSLPFSVRGVAGPELEHTGFLGANWAAYAEDIRRAGGFNESLGPGARFTTVGDEDELMRRLEAQGARRVAVPAARVRHRVSADCVSARWVLDRCYRAGLYDSTTGRISEPGLVGRWAVMERGLRVSRRLVLSGLRRERGVPFRVVCELSRLRGTLVGRRRQRRSVGR